jgi:hypothetical protein
MARYSLKFNPFLYFIIFLPLLWSCKEQQKANFMNSVAGSMNEVIVVMPKFQWDGPIGETLRSDIGYELPTFTQPEPILTLVNIPEDAFNGVFRSHRNIIFCKVSPDFQKPGIQMQRDSWAATQLILTLQAPNDSAMLQLIRNNKENIVNRIVEAEKTRAIELYRKTFDKTLFQSLLTNHSMMLYAPNGFNIQTDSGGFVWIEQQKGDNILGLFVYSYAYKDTAQFSAQSLLDKRNEQLKRFVPGGPKNSYMTTEKLVTPEYTQRIIDGKYYAELLGHWTLEHGFMGGPFVNVSTIDTKRNRIVTVEGWVYAPNQNKRNWLRQVQAIAYGVKFPE